MASLDAQVGELNLTCYQGATFDVTLTWLDANSAAINVTGYTADMKVKNGDTTVTELSTANGRITLGGSAGTIRLILSAVATTALSPQNCQYDLLLTSGAGTVTALVAGMFVVEGGVSAS